MYSDNFKKITNKEISDQINKNGYFFFEKALDQNFIKKILNEVDKEYEINANNNQPVNFFGQKFNTGILASSFACYQLITDSMVMNISSLLLGNKFRLKCQRYYESGHNYRLHWHTDNKAVGGGTTNSKGIVFIYYLCDTLEGQLEVIKESHKFTGSENRNDYTDEEIKKNYSDKLISLKGPAGSLIITHTHLIHSTNKISNPNFTRKSLFFQIDDDINNAEQKIVNPAFVKDTSNNILNFLGFGLSDNYRCVPQSNIKTTSNIFLFKLLIEILKEFFKRIPFLKKIKKKFI